MAASAFATEVVQFRGRGPGALSYEGVLHEPPGGGPWPGVIVCHAHPYYGGSMDLPVCIAVANACAARGFIALRFNFRGVGESTGESTAGEGEVEDVLAALEFLWLHPLVQSKCAGVSVAGYSFGAWAGLRAAERDPGRLCAYAGIGFGATLAESDWLPAYPGPKCFIHGARDQVVELERFEEFYARVPEPKEKHVLPADHFFIGRENMVAGIVIDFIQTHV